MTPVVADAVRAAGIRAVAINNAWTLMPDADCLFAADPCWWRSAEAPKPDEFRGERVHCKHDEHPITKKITPDKVSGVEYVPPHPIKSGSQSALQAAYRESKAQPRRLLLFGVDLLDDEVTHFHGPHGPGLRNPTVAKFARDRRAWGWFAGEPGRPEVINCNPRSGLDCFPKMTMEDALGLS